MGLKLMPPLTPTSITGGRFLYASIVLTAMLLIFRRDSLVQLADPISLGVIVVTGFSVYFLTGLTWYGAINRLSLAWTTALVVPGIPILSIVFAVMFLGERATIREVISILISVCGVLTLVLGSDPHRPSRKLPMRQTR